MKSYLAALSLGSLLPLQTVLANSKDAYHQEPLKVDIDPVKYRAACPDYTHYAKRPQYVKTCVRYNFSLMYPPAHHTAQVP